MASNIVWTAEKGWHAGPEVVVELADGRIVAKRLAGFSGPFARRPAALTRCPSPARSFAMKPTHTEPEPPSNLTEIGEAIARGLAFTATQGHATTPALGMFALQFAQAALLSPEWALATIARCVPTAYQHGILQEGARKMMRALPASQVTTMCAWCGAVVVNGGSEISHGICPSCAERVEADPTWAGEL